MMPFCISPGCTFSSHLPVAQLGPAAFAYDQRGVPDDVEGLRVGIPGNDQLADGASRVFIRVQVHRGERGIRIGAEEGVIAADHGHVIGQPQAHLLQLPHGAQSDQVVESDQGRGPFASLQAREQAGDRPLAAVSVKVALVVVGGIVGQAQGAQLGQKSLASGAGAAHLKRSAVTLTTGRPGSSPTSSTACCF